MQPFLGNVAVIAVALVFLVYRAHLQVRLRRERRLRQRVAYLVWVVAGQEMPCDELLETTEAV